MPTLLDLTRQGDVATISDASQLSKVKLLSPQQLYELWERQPWSAHAIDFSRDREGWLSVPDADRDDMIWSLSSFFVGEERVTTQFSGLVMAYEDQAEEAFLTTQQVDEARHVQHFNRFYEEVLGYDGSIDDRLARVRRDLNDSFVELFDRRLVAAGERLIADPTDLEAKIDFVVTYHMVIEGTLALTGQNFITLTFEERAILPGFLEGFRKISQDEHRHVAYGTWFLQQKAKDPAHARQIEARLLELLPIAQGVLVPAGRDPAGDWTLLGRSSAEVNEFAFTALTRRLKVIGVGLGVAA